MTRAIKTRLEANGDHKDSFSKVLAQLVEDGNATPNIESILTHVRSLRQVAGRGVVREMGAAALDGLDAAICSEIVTMVNKGLPTRGSPYHGLAAWIAGTSRKEPVELFTTNYDLLVEEALEDTRVPYFDGFVGSRSTFFDPHAMEEDPLPPRWARLWKLHGSVNWYLDGDGTVRRGTEGKPAARRLIHPSHLKYEESRRMPYFAMMDRLKAFLRRPSAVFIVCGYSFRDDHINEAIVQGVLGNPTALAVGLRRSTLARCPDGLALARRVPNLSLLAKDGAVVGTREGEWADAEGTIPPALAGVIAERFEANAGEGSGRTIEFLLGDFSRFGAFLRECLGERERGAAPKGDA